MTQWGLDTLFNPAKRHMDEEKRRLQSTREEVGDNSGGKRIDFEAGKVTIRKPAAEDNDDTSGESTTSSTKSDADPPKAKPAGTGKSDTQNLSAAAIRARERRARKTT